MKNNNKFISLALGAIMFASAPFTMAATIYDESISGDINSTTNPLTFNFTEGSNIVMGSGAIGDSTYDYDGFSFFLGSGYTLTSVTYSFYDVVTEGSISNAYSIFGVRTVPYYTLVLSNGRVDILDGTNPGTSPLSLFSSSLPLEEGLYSFGTTASGWSGHASTTDVAFWNYSIEFNVTNQNISPVPLPAAGYLLMTGLLPLILFRRKAKNA